MIMNDKLHMYGVTTDETLWKIDNNYKVCGTKERSSREDQSLRMIDKWRRTKVNDRQEKKAEGKLLTTEEINNVYL